jgi:hypothetical protein
VVLAGDLGESVSDIQSCLHAFQGVGCPVLVIAGNHDLWTGQYSSRLLWEEVLPRLARMGFVWLEGTAFAHGGTAVAGSIAWYDYSAADPLVAADPETFARDKGKNNNDAYRIDWPWSDIAFARQVGTRLGETLDGLEADPAVRQVIVVTHVPLLDCQMLRKPYDADWAFSNAYFGNLTLGQAVVRHCKVTHIIRGHTHVGRSAVWRSPDGRRIEAHVVDSHYGRPNWLALETGAAAPQAAN